MARDAYREIVDAWHGFGIADAKRFTAYLENFSVVFAYNSPAIENLRVTYRDTHEVFENGKVVSYTDDLKTLFEIQNMKDAYALTTNWFDESRLIVIDMILELHRELTKGTYDERRRDTGERLGMFRINGWLEGADRVPRGTARENVARRAGTLWRHLRRNRKTRRETI